MQITGKYLQVFKVEPKEKYVDMTLTEGEKQQDGTWVNHFWNNVRFVGKSKDEASTLNKGDKIEITSGKITPFKSEKGNYFLNTVVFDFEVMFRAEDKQEVAEDDDLPYPLD